MMLKANLKAVVSAKMVKKSFPRRYSGIIYTNSHVKIQVLIERSQRKAAVLDAIAYSRALGWKVVTYPQGVIV